MIGWIWMSFYLFYNGIQETCVIRIQDILT